MPDGSSAKSVSAIRAARSGRPMSRFRSAWSARPAYQAGLYVPGRSPRGRVKLMKRCGQRNGVVR